MPELSASWMRSLTSIVDINRQTMVAFRLGEEADRPVFAPVAAVDPRSGMIQSAATRRFPEMGSVLLARSDLQSQTAQIRLAAGTERLFGSIPLRIEYTAEWSRQLVRGTPSDPAAMRWQAGPQATHRFVVGSWGYHLGWFTVGAQVHLQSGTRYTPIVAGDINGDGRGGDPAFIPNAPGTLRDALDRMLAGAPRLVRSCLEEQRGRIAAPLSCRTGWQARMDIQLDLTPPGQVGLSDRVQAKVRLLHAGGALVRLLGLQDTPLGRVSSSQGPDTRLFSVTGFSPDTRRYSYRVNELFGQPLDYGRSRRMFHPFQVQVGVEYLIMPPTRSASRTMVDAYAVGGLDSTGVLAVLLRIHLGEGATGRALALADTLGLSASQREALTEEQAVLTLSATDLFAPVVQLVVREGPRLTDAMLVGQLNPRLAALRLLKLREHQQVLDLLTPSQHDLFLALTVRPS